MPSELIVRPGANDQQVITELLAPTPSSTLPFWGPPVSRVVVDAHLLGRSTAVADAASAVGIPFVIDPDTYLTQSDLRPTDLWAKLPFGQARALSAREFEAESARDDFVDRVISFEVEAGATAVIAPYFYAASPDDEWFDLSVDMIDRTLAFMNSAGIRLPLIAVLCGQLQSFGRERVWADGIDRFAGAAVRTGASAVSVCLSPSGSQHDAYPKVLRLFRVVDRLHNFGVPVFAWRQGVYGRALVAAGAAGYETGMGTNEQTNIPRAMANRRPHQNGKKKSGAAAPGIYIDALGRSLAPKVAQALFGNLRMRAKVMCDDENCCPLGVRSTLEQHRQHSVRSRSRALNELDEMPQRTWRLHRIARDARGAATLIDQSNKILRAERIDARLSPVYADSLARVSEFLLAADGTKTQPAS